MTSKEAEDKILEAFSNKSKRYTVIEIVDAYNTVMQSHPRHPKINYSVCSCSIRRYVTEAYDFIKNSTPQKKNTGNKTKKNGKIQK